MMQQPPTTACGLQGFISGATQAPHYGHGHEDKDTFAHFEGGFENIAEEGSAPKAMHVGASYV